MINTLTGMQLPSASSNCSCRGFAKMLMTTSSKGLACDATGNALNLRGSQWVSNELYFMENALGHENLVSVTWHQGEVTLHIHVVIVLVTREQRLHKGQPTCLSCRELFSPSSLRQLRTTYAKDMAPHKFERGVKCITVIHERVRRHYGTQQMSTGGCQLWAAQYPRTTSEGLAYPLRVARSLFKSKKQVDGYSEKNLTT